jgi:hypothetical protein
MPVMNATPLKDARSDKWASEYGVGSGGFEWWQVVIGVVVFVVATLILWLPFSYIGVGLGAFAGFAAAVAPNHLDTHHKHPRKYLEGLIKKRLNHSLLLNDKRVAEPADELEAYFVEITEFPIPNPETPHD